MSVFVMLAVLGSAFFHALWNTLIKSGTNRMAATVILSLGEIPFGLAVAASRPMLATEALPWVVAAGCTHFFYKLFLTLAYQRGDLSRVYPIARGTAPLIVAVVSAFFLGEVLTPQEFAGILVLGLGILMMAGGVIFAGENRRLIPFALGSAVATSIYTLIDAHGAKISGDAVAYVAWVFIADGVIFAGGVTLWKGTGFLPRERKPWITGLIAAAASYVAYAISIWATTVAPVSLVAALRETSILFAVAMGWVFFHEKMTGTKALAALVIVGGVVLTRL
jgi:drug/metabolite transporter (DMT)-like permease